MYLILDEGEMVNTDRFEKLKIFHSHDTDDKLYYEIALCNKMVYPDDAYENGVHGVLAATQVYMSYDCKKVEQIYKIIQYHMVMGDLPYLRIKNLEGKVLLPPVLK